jgi:hypothetical protein
MNTEERSNLESEIISTIKAIPATIPRGRGLTEWTAEVKSALRSLGKRKDYAVCPGPGDKAWLFDLIWFRNDQDHRLREVVLVVESEWSLDSDEIIYDFEKLLVAKSPIKLMVFQDHQENLTQLWSLLETGISSFQAEPANEKYILAGFRNSEYVFEFKTI